MSESMREKALESALLGLDFMVRHQVADAGSADCGRFANVFDCTESKVLSLTTNWTTGVCIEALLSGHALTGNPLYLDAAKRAVGYLSSLQYLGAGRMCGVIREETPQTSWAHPRDALTAAWALLDFARHTGEEACFERALLYAQWYLDVALEKGYPHWTVRLDGEPWLPEWCGSFHSGGAFFFYRLFKLTGEGKYRDAVFRIVDFYNRHHLRKNGRIQVVVDRETLEPIHGYKAMPDFSCSGWEEMHEYNDDFGALANLAAYDLGQCGEYLDAAHRFLARMLRVQRPDGGFGPEAYSVPSAGGAVLMELLAAAQLERPMASADQLERIARYLLNLQVVDSRTPADGAFLGFNDDYEIDHVANVRTAAYAIMGLFRYAGVVDPFYFFESKTES